MAEELSANTRFKALWNQYVDVDGGLIEAVLTERSPEGSLRWDKKVVKVAGEVGAVLCVNNGEVVFNDKDPEMLGRLALLERVAELQLTTV